MTLKRPNLKTVKQIKFENGTQYVRAYNSHLVKLNGLENHPLNVKLSAFDEDEYYVVVGIKNHQNEYIKIGYTSSPWTYWLNLLKEKEYTIQSIYDVEIMHDGLDKSSALRMGRSLNSDITAINRCNKIKNILEDK